MDDDASSSVIQERDGRRERISSKVERGELDRGVEVKSKLTFFVSFQHVQSGKRGGKQSLDRIIAVVPRRGAEGKKRAGSSRSRESKDRGIGVSTDGV